jgi:hypothetical protein
MLDWIGGERAEIGIEATRIGGRNAQTKAIR